MLGHFFHGFGSVLAGFHGVFDHGHSGFGTSGSVFQVVFNQSLHSFLAFNQLGFHGLGHFGTGAGHDVIHMTAVGHRLFESGLHQSGLSGQHFLGVLGGQQALGVAERLAHSSFASGQVQLDQTLETGESGLGQASSGLQVGFVGSGELFGVEVHDGFLEEVCCNAALVPASPTHGKGFPPL